MVFCDSIFHYKRRDTIEVMAGAVGIGGINPIRIQSMTTTNTLDTNESVAQAIRIIDEGGELVRLTTQGRREARNLENIKRALWEEGYPTPLVADIHFNPNAAEIAARNVEKVRINPGNFVDGAKKFRIVDTDEDSWNEGIKQVEEKLIPFLEICKKNNTALRIGCNHGSLSDRIMSRYGDTAEGMVESCMEYLRICRDNDFSDIVLSIKASNTRIMVHTVRLLVATMNEEGMSFPLHLGVTEAGEGEDGRIKSAVGIGALLADGLGDTIRVSLTEEPENEISVAKTLIQQIKELSKMRTIKSVDTSFYSPYEYKRRTTQQVLDIGGQKPPIVIHQYYNIHNQEFIKNIVPDYVYCNSIEEINFLPDSIKVICPIEIFKKIGKQKNCYPLYNIENLDELSKDCVCFIELSYNQLNSNVLKKLEKLNSAIIIADVEIDSGLHEHRAFSLELQNNGLKNPLIVKHSYYDVKNLKSFQLTASVDSGLLFLDGLADGLFIINNFLKDSEVIGTQFSILQAARVRFSKTEYISCPGCGRTLFALQEVTTEVKKRTSHLKNLKIAVMGCVVNGIGEMADADYGYVGSGPDKVSLFKQKEEIVKSIPENQALDALIDLIKKEGDWIDP